MGKGLPRNKRFRNTGDSTLKVWVTHRDPETGEEAKPVRVIGEGGGKGRIMFQTESGKLLEKGQTVKEFKEVLQRNYKR